jgi:hypothetical protein
MIAVAGAIYYSMCLNTGTSKAIAVGQYAANISQTVSLLPSLSVVLVRYYGTSVHDSTPKYFESLRLVLLLLLERQSCLEAYQKRRQSRSFLHFSTRPPSRPPSWPIVKAMFTRPNSNLLPA